jgi:hypothetical protein
MGTGTRIISVDPFIDKKSSRIAQWFAKNDRGSFLRNDEELADVFLGIGAKVKTTINRDGLRIPLDSVELEIVL